MTARSIGRLATLVLALAGTGGAAMAQLKPLPFQPPAGPSSAAASPSAQGTPDSAPRLQPLQPMAPQPLGASASPPINTPMGGFSSPGMGGPGMGGSGMGGPAAGGAPPPEMQQCLDQFSKLREEVERRGKLAKAGNDGKVGREEMCKLISDIVGAEDRWIKFSVANVRQCGIPPEVLPQLKGNHAKTVGFKKMACSAGPAGGAPAAPSLSDALGTSRLPTSDNAVRGGTLDTLTGNPIR